MSLTQFLSDKLEQGAHRIGQIEIRKISDSEFWLFHETDTERVAQEDHGDLAAYTQADRARDLSTYSEEGEYRFAKGQINLRKGWILILPSIAETHRALDLFYPAAVGLVAALDNGTLQIENLRDKLNRQTGMYRFAREISTAGAQKLVKEVCGPAHQCAKRILWQIDQNTPIEDSEASRYTGIPGHLSEQEAIPLLCREACNHFVAECRKVSKEESSKR